MTRTRTIAAAACGLALGLITLLATLTIEPEYQAKASATLRPLLSADDLAAALRTKDVHVRLRFAGAFPYLPNPRRPHTIIAEQTARRVGAIGADAIKEAVTVSDTAYAPVFAQFKEPERKLKVAAVDDSPERAARIATAFAAEYVAYRTRWYERTLSNTRRTLRRLIRSRSTEPSIVPGGVPNASEALEAVALTARLERNAIRSVRPAAVPTKPIFPRRARDTIVAVLIGVLLGWFGAPLLLRLPPLRRSRLTGGDEEGGHSQVVVGQTPERGH